MKRSFSITDRDRAILLAVLHKVPILSEAALALWWQDTDSSRDNMSRRLWQLREAGLLARYSLPVQAAPRVELFYHWVPGMPEPDFGALAWQLSRRWQSLETRRTVFYTATATAANRYGRTVQNPLRSTSAIPHAILLGQLFAQLHHTAPTLASGWVAEEVVADSRGYGQKVVDCLIVDSSSTPALALEIAGASYAASNGERLREIHKDCSERGLPYEMWTVPEGGGK
jgi:hypothetical protein